MHDSPLTRVLPARSLTRLRKRFSSLTPPYLIRAAPASDVPWSQLGASTRLIPGLAQLQVQTPLVEYLIFDESGFVSGAWANLMSSARDRLIDELEVSSAALQQAGGVVVGILRRDTRVDVNTERVRQLYDIVIHPGAGDECEPLPTSIQRIQALVNAAGRE